MPKNPKGRIKAYEDAKKLEEPNSMERLLMCYDRIRRSAAKHDAGAVLEVVKLLESSLRFEANPMFAWRQQQLYSYLRKCVELKHFQEACRIADELHTMWKQGLAAEANRIEEERANSSAAEPEKLR